MNNQNNPTDNKMPFKRYISRETQSGNIIVGVIFIVIIVGILSLIFGKPGTEDTTKKPVPKIHIQNIDKDTVSTTEQQYSLTATIEKSSYDIQEVKGYLNDKPISVIQDFQAGENHYNTQLSLKPGDNIFKIAVQANDIGQPSTELATKKVTVHLTATEAPSLNISKATQDGVNWKVDDYTEDVFDLRIETTPKTSKNSGAVSLTINDSAIQATTNGFYDHKLTALKDGTNIFTITAKNEAGEIQGTLTINKLSSAEQEARANLTNIISEAEVTCKQHAEKQLLVKDINVGYDQSSIKRKNPDGTILIKANIADSQGFWRQQKPLGIMECTTDPTGMLVLNFEHY